MTTYKEIFGKPVKVVDTDPTDAQAEGQVWYNTTDGVFKTVLSAGAWSAGGNLGTARAQGGASGSTQNDALYAGGITSSQVANTEEYDGSSWTGGGNLTTARYRLAGANFAPQTAGLVFGGRAPSPPGGSDRNETEEYNGSSWSEQNNLSTARRALAGAGIQTSAIAVGGEGPLTVSTEEYDGSSWTGGGNYPTATMGMGSFGATGTSAIAVGGADAVAGGLTRGAIYDGSSWTSIAAIPVGRSYMAGFGTTTSGMIAGGYSAPGAAISNATSYDGTNWTVENSLATARFYNGGGGSSGTSGVVFAGLTPPATNATEEFSFSIFSPIAATWASGGNLNAPRDSLSTAAQATQNAAFVFGGHNNSGSMNSSESYNGTAWTATNTLPVAKQLAGGAGTQAAALCFSGNTTGVVATTETWDGSNWTAVAAPGGTVGTGRINAGSAGVQGAALLFGGGPPTTANSEEWNGSSWSEGNNLSRGTTGADNICGAGIQTSALAMGGTAPSFVYNTTEEYNGTSWTGGGGMNTARRRAAAAASTVDSGLCFGGLASPGSGQTAASELYDGTSWTNTASMGTARYYLGGSGATQGDGFAMGGLLTGSASSFTDKTEEYSAEQQALDYKTLTSS